MVLEPTGWYSYDEFAYVFSRLRHPEEYASIATKIAVWKSRAKVPAAVTATESLISAVVADHQCSLSESGLRSLYAMAVIRAVNLLLDHEQDREYARSLRVLAKECELPEYIITVRNECSHREIPDLNTLRLAAFDAINYVYNKYWSAQHKSIVFKLSNPEYDALCMSSLLIGCYSSALTKLPLDAADPCVLWAGYRGGGSEARLALCRRDHVFDSAVITARRLVTIATRRSYLSMWRRIHWKYKAVDHAHSWEARSLYQSVIVKTAGTARRLADGCAHQTFFVSAFVEFVFAHFEPDANSVFIVFMLEFLDHLPFNFAIELAAAALCIVFDLPDGLTDEQNRKQRPMYFDRIAQYSKFLSSTAATSVRSVQSGASRALEQESAEPGSARRRVNAWLISMLSWANMFEHKRYCHRLPMCIRTLACGVTADAQRLWVACGNGLARFAAATHALLPNVAVQLSYRGTLLPAGLRWNPQPWESDRLSHALGMLAWISGFLENGLIKKYVFSSLSTSEVQKRLKSLKGERKVHVTTVDRMLLPGTLWDPVRWRIQHTVRRLGESHACHSRVLSALDEASERCPVLLPSKISRRFQRSARRSTKPSAGNHHGIRALMQIYGQLAAPIKSLAHRERYS
ncbi:Las1-like family protein, putative [Babesia bigemina]|uniref:Las1-like family protein, putative n=1 Tax=Babesia bigemina TaxID=5866 RepID=A0A061D803_BABBI|nr:Las1-like family protein, putative [Babesia bigemina]CDR93835.1 Las1-like family protein, putative [Babesia bigemina]|eukprot:XP_012766021.1 Las1-like family protein, putative [Babesia bigemina]